MKVYLAARWSRREELCSYADALRSYGVEVTSRWLTDPEHRIAAPNDERETQAFNATLAGHDWDDIRASDVLVYFAPGGSRGGCHVEFGLALAWGKRVVLIGEREHVFTWLPRVERYPTWQNFIVTEMANAFLGPERQPA